MRFLTDTMMNGHKINKMFGHSAACQCGFPVEHRFHQLLDCQIYNDLREFCINSMTKIITSKHPNQISGAMVRQRNAMAHLILDPSWFRYDIGSEGKGLPCIMTKETADQLEHIGRTFCFQLYKRRFETYSKKEDEEDTDSEDDEDDFSLHDTTEDSSSENDSDVEF